LESESGDKKGQDGTLPFQWLPKWQPWYSRQDRPCAMRGGANHELISF
jgi:hypothetical protein